MRITVFLLFAALSYAQDTNPFGADPKAAELGRVMFRIYCAPCHGIKADGGRGPDLTLGTYTAGDRDRDLFRVIARGVPGTEMAAYSGRVEDEAIWRMVSYIRSASRHDTARVEGDKAAGEKIFWGKGNCGECHQVGTKGASIGPDLSRTGRQRSLAYLRASVVKPDDDLTPGYSTITVVLRDGKKLSGVEKSVDNFSAQFVDLAGKYYSFRREDVTSIKQEARSLMPSFDRLLSAGELNDLLAYLNSLRGGQ
jgi:putative heme-binding domain-containing protein